MKKTTLIFIYALYALTAGVVFLYLLFPSDPIREIMSEQLAKTRTNIEIHTDTIRPTIPPGLRFQPLSVIFAGTPALRSDKVKVRPHLLSLLADTKILSFKGPLGSGRFSGRAELAQALKNDRKIINLNLIDVPLEAIDFFNQWPQYAPFGSMDGQIMFDSQKGGNGKVEADITIVSIRFVIDPPLMGLEVLEFAELQAKVSATNRQLTIDNCEAFGSQLEGKVSGFIAIRQPIGSSRPTLSVTVKPQPAFIAEHKNDMIGGLLASRKTQQRGLVFQISGTLDNPSYVIR